MRFAEILGVAIGMAGLAWATGCGTSGTNPSTPTPTNTPPNGPSLPALSGANVIPLTVNGSTCSANTYPNKPCVSVTLCDPSHPSVCQTINDVLVDTGSYGLRIFKSVLTSVTLTPMTVSQSGQSLTVYGCAQYGDGSSDWGPLAQANLIMGGEPAVTVPIQLIDPANAGSHCGTPDTSPSTTGYNGILGVGVFLEECGASCETNAANGVYFGCNGSTCTGITLPRASQLLNPVAALPVDNNGLILELPSIPLGGAVSASGYLVLGIGTQSNNIPSGVSTYPASASGEFSTSFNGKSYGSFLDSGSNGLFFPGPSSLPDCKTIDAQLEGFYCPASTQAFSATTVGSGGRPSATVNFQIGNFADLSVSGNRVFVEAGGNAGGPLGGTFDWGLPFYLGRNVYEGFEDRSSSLGSGPYWAY